MRALGGFDSPFQRSSIPVQNPYSDPSLLESDADKSFSQSTLQQTAQKRFHSNDAAIVQREQEINDIANGIIELADIFRDLQTMVIDQGTMLDRIDYNVERTVVEVKAAEKELTTVRLIYSHIIFQCKKRRCLRDDHNGSFLLIFPSTYRPQDTNEDP
jgi:syntaxin 16